MKNHVKTLLACAAVCVLSLITANEAQAQIPRFQTLTGTSTQQIGRAIRQLPDSSYVVAGYAYGTNDYDVYLVRLDRNGNQLWSFTYNIGGNDYAYNMDIAADGGIIITGKTQNNNNCIRDDIFLLKTSNAGVLQWTMTYGGSGDEEGTSVMTTADGGFIVSGRTNSFGAGDYDACLLKTTSTGGLTWWRSYGWANTEYFKSVDQTSDGGYVACGGTSSVTGNPQYWLVRVNSSGVLSWSRNLGGTGTEVAWAVRETSDGGYITAGTETSYTTTPDAMMVKFNAAGTFQWARTYEFGSNWDEFLSVRETCTEELIFCGYCQGSGFTGLNGYVLKTTNLGAKIWSRAYGGTTGGEFLWDIIQTSDGGYATAGQSSMSGGFGSDDNYVVKMESAAGSSSCRDTLLNEATTARTIATDNTAPNVSQMNIAFAITSTRTSYGQWTRLCFDAGTSYGNPCVLGLRQPGSDLGGAPDQDNVMDYAGETAPEMIMLKQSSHEVAGQMRVLPNPVEAGAPFVVEIPATEGEATITITDVLGRVMYQQTVADITADGGMKITTSGWTNGTYVVSMKTSAGVRSVPVVVRH